MLSPIMGFSQYSPRSAHGVSPASSVQTMTAGGVFGVPSSTRARFGMGQAVAQGIQSMMAPINNSRLLELFISDFLGMTFPRTYIETKMRGFETGRETLLRELVGGLTPVYVCGWAGAAAILGLERMPFNPKKMSFRAWIDASMLEHLGDVTAKHLATSKTSLDLKKRVIQDVVGRLRTTDRIATIAEYKPYFKHLQNTQALSQSTVETMSNRLLRFKLPDYTPGQFMTSEHKLLQKEFVAELSQYAVKEGGLTSRVVLMQGSKPNMRIGPRSIHDVLSKVSTFLDEYLNRAMKGLSPEAVLTRSTRRQIHQRLFGADKGGLLSRVIPKATEGLLPYMYKLKWTLVGVPLLATAIFACSFAQINNWLTRRRFGGRQFFPGEGIPSDVADKVERTAFERDKKPTKDEEQH
jgi:hypothetical protein